MFHVAPLFTIGTLTPRADSVDGLDMLCFSPTTLHVSIFVSWGWKWVSRGYGGCPTYPPPRQRIVLLFCH
jgi:hypothetical protein